MELTVLAHGADHAGLVRVEAAGVAGWCTWPDAPDVGAVVDVELGVEGEVSWDDLQVDRPTGGHGAGPAPGLVVQAVVVDVDEQDVATLRLPGGAILLVDTVGEPPLHVLGRTVSLHSTTCWSVPRTSDPRPWGFVGKERRSGGRSRLAL